jgi:hypothetical protein
MPAGSKRCFKLSSPRYCGNRKFCKEGYVCKDENTCVAESAPGSAAPRTVSQSDCSCISVIPTVPGREYNVTNSCGRMFVSVRFGGDTLHVSPRVGAFTSWIDAGELSVGEIGTVKPPAHWTISSITGISIRSGDSSFTCTF